jgi:hypothetical protein
MYFRKKNQNNFPLKNQNQNQNQNPIGRELKLDKINAKISEAWKYGSPIFMFSLMKSDTLSEVSFVTDPSLINKKLNMY